jgi:hypothetical protein
MGVVAQAARKVRITHSESVVSEVARREYVDHVGSLLARNILKTINLRFILAVSKKDHEKLTFCREFNPLQNALSYFFLVSCRL